jgi:hypothetical protein
MDNKGTPLKVGDWIKYENSNRNHFGRICYVSHNYVNVEYVNSTIFKDYVIFNENIIANYGSEIDRDDYVLIYNTVPIRYARFRIDQVLYVCAGLIDCENCYTTRDDIICNFGKTKPDFDYLSVEKLTRMFSLTSIYDGQAEDTK